MLVDIIETIAGLAALESDWRRVYEADPDAQFFLSWTWMRAWLDGLNVPWLILAAKPDAESNYVAFFPALVTTHARADGTLYNVLRNAGIDAASLGGLLCEPAHDAAAIPAIARAAQRFNWAALRFDRLTLGKERIELFASAFDTPVFAGHRLNYIDDGTDYSIYPFVRLPADFETFMKRIGKVTRKTLRSHLRKVEEDPSYTITHADAETFDRDLDNLLRLWIIRWEPEKGAARTEREVHNFRAMFRACFAAGAAMIITLWKEGRPIGAQAVLIDRKNNALLCVVGSRDLTVKRPSPGIVVDLHTIRWAIENGFAIYDLLQGNHSYKYDFAAEERHVDGFLVETVSKRNLRGQLEPRALVPALDLAERMFADGEILRAKVACEQILLKAPAWPNAVGLRARIDASPPRDFEAARKCYIEGRVNEAELICRGLLAQNPDYFEPRFLLGTLLWQHRQPEAALEHLVAATRLRPDDAAAHNNLGNAQRALGRLDDALASFERALALTPGDVLAINNLATVHHERGQYEEALACYDRALALNPDYTAAQHNRDRLLHDMDAAHEQAAKSAAQAGG